MTLYCVLVISVWAISDVLSVYYTSDSYRRKISGKRKKHNKYMER